MSLSHLTWGNWGSLAVTQGNHSEFSLESNVLGFDHPPTQFPSPEVRGFCLPQAVLARELSVPSCHMDGFPGKAVSHEGSLLLGLALWVWACRLHKRVPLRGCAGGSITHSTHPCHRAQLGPGPRTRCISIVAQQEAGPVSTAALAHWEQLASGALAPGALGCAWGTSSHLLQPSPCLLLGGGLGIFVLFLVNSYVFGRHDRKKGVEGSDVSGEGPGVPLWNLSPWWTDS